MVEFDLVDVSITNPDALVAQQVDLNGIDDYADHKDELDGIVDLAVVGKITNTGPQAIDVVIYMTPAMTTLTSDTAVRAGGIMLWGPFSLTAGTMKTVDWDESAKLFTDVGKTALLEEVLGDGSFPLYFLAESGTYSFTIVDGVLIVVIHPASDSEDSRFHWAPGPELGPGGSSPAGLCARVPCPLSDARTPKRP